MRTLRLLTVLALLVTLPAYGLAGLTAVRGCHMAMGWSSGHLQARHDAHAASAASASLMQTDCCPGKTNSGTPCKGSGGTPLDGKRGACSACKAGLSCKSPEPYERGHVRVTLTSVAHLGVGMDSPPLILSSRPGHPWRPPRL